MRRYRLKGASTIEFVGGFFSFWLICMAWVEMSFISYMSGVLDVTIADTSRTSKKEDDNYLETFKRALEDDNKIWRFIADPENFTLKIEYLDDLLALEQTDNNCIIPDDEYLVECGEQNSVIALYSLSYRYRSMFLYFGDIEGVMSREMFVVQEYEREKL